MGTTETQETIGTCYNCERAFFEQTQDNMITGPDNETYCEDCHNEFFAWCDVCECVVGADNTTAFNDKMYCESCADERLTTCRNCGDTIHRDNVFYSEITDNNYCSDCYDEQFGCCQGCDSECLSEDINENGYCPECSGEDNAIHSYDYRPTPIFCGTDSSLHFGIELEIENVADRVYNNDTAEDLPEFTYAKTDGTLNDGFEIVSHPATWAWLQEHKKTWADLLEKLRKNGYRSYDTKTCGMHIHLSKKAFSTLHLYKFLKLVYENPEFVARISRRPLYNLQRWASVEIDERLIYKAKKGDCKERYTAVNLQNDKTIELRIFRGTLSPQGFWINLEFCKSVYDYTAIAGISEISTQHYVDYVKKNYRDCLNLYRFIMQNYSVKG